MYLTKMSEWKQTNSISTKFVIQLLYSVLGLIN